MPSDSEFPAEKRFQNVASLKTSSLKDKENAAARALQYNNATLLRPRSVNMHTLITVWTFFLQKLFQRIMFH